MSDQYLSSEGILVLPDQAIPPAARTGTICVYNRNGKLHSMDSDNIDRLLGADITLTADSGIFGEDQSTIGVTNTSVVRTITLAIIAAFNGKTLIVQDHSGAAATNNITIDTEGTQKINGADSIVIDSDYGGFDLYSDGVDWFARPLPIGGAALSSGAALQLEQLAQTATHTADFSPADPSNNIVQINNIPTFTAILAGVYEFTISARIIDLTVIAMDTEYFLGLFVDGVRGTNIPGRSIGVSPWNARETIVKSLTAGQTVDFGISYNKPDAATSVSGMTVICKQLPETEGSVLPSTTFPIKKITVPISSVIDTATVNTAAHGLDLTKIIGLNAVSKNIAGTLGTGEGSTVTSAIQFNLHADASNVIITITTGNSDDLIGRTIDVIVTHEV